MIYRLLADLVVIVHLLFILFVLFGGLLGLWRRWLLWVHLPALGWGMIVELASLICPLTPLEQSLRMAGGEPGYSGGFIVYYIEPIIYPPGLTPTIQVLLGIAVLVINIGVYAIVWLRLRSAKQLQ